MFIIFLSSLCNLHSLPGRYIRSIITPRKNVTRNTISSSGIFLVLSPVFWRLNISEASSSFPSMSSYYAHIMWPNQIKPAAVSFGLEFQILPQSRLVVEQFLVFAFGLQLAQGTSLTGIHSTTCDRPLMHPGLMRVLRKKLRPHHDIKMVHQMDIVRLLYFPKLFVPVPSHIDHVWEVQK